MFNFTRTLFSSDDVEYIGRIHELPKECYYLVHDGRIYNSIDQIGPNKLIQLQFRLLGGKGGFGSLLRSFRIHKSTNQLMCRDLNGRRLADVKEEEKLKRWIEKKEQRDKDKQLKKQEKLERLRQGPSKHEFKDQQYLEARDRILDQTENAIEAGMSALEDKSSGNENLRDVSEDSMSTDSSLCDTELGLYDNERWVPITSANTTSGVRKRKQKFERNDLLKRIKIEYTSNLIFDYFTDEILEQIAGLTYSIAKKVASEQQQQKTADDSVSGFKNKNVEVNYEHIELERFNTSTELCALGLEHLKHALIERGLKCGGSLDERAARLFAVRGLDEKAYPKKLRANIKCNSYQI